MYNLCVLLLQILLVRFWWLNVDLLLIDVELPYNVSNALMVGVLTLRLSMNFDVGH